MRGPRLSASSLSTSRDPAGSSTTPPRSGASPARSPARPSRPPGIALEDLAGIGITNQRETVRPLGPRDGRAGAPRPRLAGPPHRRHLPADEERTGIEADIRARTGLLIDPYFSATKLAWLFERHPELRRRAEAGELAAGTIDSWLVWKLTGGRLHLTDHTNASRTLLYNLDTARLGSRAPGRFGVPRAVLPRSAPPARSTATSDRRRRSARRSRSRGIAGDQQAALFGQGCWTAGLGEEHLRYRRLPPAAHGGAARRVGATGCSPPSPAARGESAPSPWRAPSSSPGPRCSGCGTSWASSSAAEETDALAARAGVERRRLLRARLHGPGRPALGARARGECIVGPHARDRRRRTSPARRSRRWPTPRSTWRR